MILYPDSEPDTVPWTEPHPADIRSCMLVYVIWHTLDSMYDDTVYKCSAFGRSAWIAHMQSVQTTVQHTSPHLLADKQDCRIFASKQG